MSFDDSYKRELRSIASSLDFICLLLLAMFVTMCARCVDTISGPQDSPEKKVTEEEK